METCRIGLIGDIHASPQALAEALQLFEQQRVDRILCTGDIVGYFEDAAETVELLIQTGCDCVIGNHDVSYLSAEKSEAAVSDYLSELPLFREFEIAGMHIYLVHAEPPDILHGGIKLLDESGEFIHKHLQAWQDKLTGFDADILVVGHTHQVYTTSLNGLLVLNPGSLAFNHSCMILDLPQKTVQTFALGGHNIVPSWNFSMQFKNTKGLS